MTPSTVAIVAAVTEIISVLPSTSMRLKSLNRFSYQRRENPVKMVVLSEELKENSTITAKGA